MTTRSSAAQLSAAGAPMGSPFDSASAPEPVAQEEVRSAPAEQFRITRLSPAYWRVTIDHPPFNIFGPESVPMLAAVISQMETDPNLKVVVFDSTVPGFFLTHYDFLQPLERTTEMLPGPTGLPPLPDLLARLSRAPVVSIVEIRGRATGVGSELALASDMRFASLEKAVLSQFEIGAGFIPGGGPMARLPPLVGRGRALEILLGGNDIPAALAERYGYVNRALPDGELAGFVDALARRMASFDKRTIAGIKALVNEASLPTDRALGAEWEGFLASVQRPAAQDRIQALLAAGLQRDVEVEANLARSTGEVSHRLSRL